MTSTIVMILVIFGLIALAAIIIGSHMMKKENSKPVQGAAPIIEHGESRDKIQFKFAEEVLHEETNWDRFEGIMEQYSATLTGDNRIFVTDGINSVKVFLYLEDPDNETYINEIINFILSYEHLIPNFSNIDFVINFQKPIADSIISTSSEEIKTLKYKRGE